MRLRGNVLDIELDHRFGPDFESNFGSILLRKSKMCDQKIVFFFACGELSLMKEAKKSQKAPQAKNFGVF